MRKFLLIDDHVMIRSGLKECISKYYQPCEVDEAEDTDSTIEKLKEHKYDLLVMDVQIPGNDMLRLMEYISVKYRDTKVLMFSISPEHMFAKRFLKAGAKGFLSKNSSMEEIANAINVVLSGNKFISPAFAQILADDSAATSALNPFDKLSHREFEIVQMLLAGDNATKVSAALHITPSTIATHKARAFEKLGVTNLLEAMALSAAYHL